MKNTNINTLDITAKEWFDKVNGNSYFSAQITINFATDTEQTIYVPFQYGYGEHYQTVAIDALKNAGYFTTENSYALWRICKENKIVLNCNKQTGYKKSEVKSFGIN